MGFWLNLLNNVRSSHKLKILSRFIEWHKTHQLHHTRDFFKLLHFLNKTVAKVAYKLLNGTTGAVSQTVYQFTVFSSCSMICNTIHFRITNL